MQATDEDLDEEVPPTLEQCTRTQQQELLRHLEVLSRSEGELTLVLDDGSELRAAQLRSCSELAFAEARVDDGGSARCASQYSCTWLHLLTHSSAAHATHGDRQRRVQPPAPRAAQQQGSRIALYAM